MANGPLYVLNPSLAASSHGLLLGRDKWHADGFTNGLTLTADGHLVYGDPTPPAPVCFIAGGNMTNAGARLRAYWPAQFIPGAAVVTWADAPPPAAVYVFQKLVDLPLMTRLLAGGALCFWDVCDPAWWFNPSEVREVLALATGVVASSEALAADLRNFAGGGVRVHCIADRVLLSHYAPQATHGDRTPVRFIWFGAGQNRMALYAAHANLQRLQANGYDIALTICDNAPNAPMDIEGDYPVYYTRWTLETEAATLAAHDIALLPPYPGPWGKVKSDNKRLVAGACNLPVTTGRDYEEMELLVADPSYRATAADIDHRYVERVGRVEQSAAEWQALIAAYAGVTVPALEVNHYVHPTG